MAGEIAAGRAIAQNLHGGCLLITEEDGVHILHDVCAYIKEFAFVLD